MVYLRCSHCQTTTEHEFKGILEEKRTRKNAFLYRCTECLYTYRYDENGIYSMPAD